MPLTESQWKRLRKYVRQRDRAVEPVFAGRKPEIDAIEDSIGAASEGDHIGMTMCFSGPPGIGKTALLAECRRRVEENKSAIWVPVHSSVLHNPDSVVLAVAEAMLQMPNDRVSPSGLRRCTKIAENSGREVKAEAALGGGVGHVKVITDVTKKDNPQPAKGHLSAAPWRTLGQLRDTIKDKPPFVFAVDEAHKLKGSDGDYGTCNDLLQALHEGGNVPIIPILAGHVHTPEVIEKSISKRFADDLNLFMANLTKSESKDYVVGVLEYLEADGDFNAIADWIYGESDGFPHHIRGGLSSIAKCMLQADSLRIDDLDTNAIEQTFSEGRCKYYAQRMGEELPYYYTAVSDVLKAAETPKSVSHRTIVETLTRGIQDMIESGKAPSDPIDARALFKILIRQGAIARTGPSHYTCLIRSLARYADSQSHMPHAHFPAQKCRLGKSSVHTMGNPG